MKMTLTRLTDHFVFHNPPVCKKYKVSAHRGGDS